MKRTIADAMADASKRREVMTIANDNWIDLLKVQNAI